MTQEEVLERVQFCSEFRGLSKNTQEEYYTKTKRFQQFHGKSATELSIVDIQNYLRYLSKEKGLSAGSVNTYNSGLRFLYQVALDIPLNLSQILCQRRCRKYPDLLTRQEIETMLSVCDNLRDRAMLATMYGAGLRISEVACLRVEDIDSAKMQLYVRDGKGRKDCFALLSQKNLELLRTYWKAYRPKDWMFYSRNAKSTGTHITVRGISNAFTNGVSLPEFKNKLPAIV